MPASNWRRRWLVSALACAALGCARNPAPKGWLATLPQAQADPYGAWIVISRGAVSEQSGELLAVEHDSVFFLSSDREVRAVPRDSAIRARIWFYDSQWDKLATWSGLGALGSISNGFLAILTLPAWIIGGSLATASQSRAPLARVNRPADWDAVRMYARFPAGLPANLPRMLPAKLQP